MYLKGVGKVEEAVKINEKEAMADVIMANYLSAQYFFVCKRNEVCKKMLRRTIEAGTYFKEHSGSDEYNNFVDISKNLLARLEEEEAKAKEPRRIDENPGK